MNPAPDQPPSSSESSTVTHSAPVTPTVPASTNTNQPLINNLPSKNAIPATAKPSMNYSQPVPTIVSNPIAQMQNVPPTTASSISPASNPPFEPPIVNASTQTVSQLSAKHQSKKFPFMMITFFLALIIAGFSGSFLFFSYTKAAVQKVPVQIFITPPASIESALPLPTLSTGNPFASPSSDLTNPFASPTASLVNPFGTYNNPFATAATSSSQSSQPYQNPFENLK